MNTPRNLDSGLDQGVPMIKSAGAQRGSLLSESVPHIVGICTLDLDTAIDGRRINTMANNMPTAQRNAVSKLFMGDCVIC